MNLDGLALVPDEMGWFRSLVLGDENTEKRLIGLVRGGRLQQAVRTGTCAEPGPLREVPGLRVDGAAHRLRALDIARGADRVIALDASALEAEEAPSLLDAVFAGNATADPPWLASRSSLEGTSRWLRVPVGRLFPDGGYALLESSANGDPTRVVWARVAGGHPEEIGGSTALGASDTEDPDELLAALRERVAPLHLAVSGSTVALRALAASTRPANALEHARIRETLSVLALSPRFALSLLALRMVGC